MAQIRITMAAIDPTAPPEADEEGNLPAVPRSTLKILKERIDSDDEEDDSDDEQLRALLTGGDSDSDSGDDDETNGGPSDPSKSKKSRREAALKELLAKADSDSDMEDAETQPNGTKSKKGKKGKERAGDDDSDEGDEEDSDDGEAVETEEYVVCTLDTERVSSRPYSDNTHAHTHTPPSSLELTISQNYQQPLDIVIQENETVFFIVSGTHTIYLTGNYVIHDDEEEEDSDYDSEEEYDLPPDMNDEDELSDELDEVEGVTRIQEVDTDDEEAPQLVESSKKGKNKRPAEDEAENLDDMVASDGKKLSKKQQKKLKTEAAAKEAAKESPASAKKVQFAKELEQGPTGPAKEKADKKPKTGVKIVQGVTIDDRKIGTGRTVKAGDKVGMRYIGKLENGKVFDGRSCPLWSVT